MILLAAAGLAALGGCQSRSFGDGGDGRADSDAAAAKKRKRKGPEILNAGIAITQKVKESDRGAYAIVNPTFLHEVASRDTLTDAAERAARDKLLSGYFAVSDKTFITCADPAGEKDAAKCKVVAAKQKVSANDWRCEGGTCSFFLCDPNDKDKCVDEGLKLGVDEIKSFVDADGRAREPQPPFVKTSFGYYQCRAGFVGPVQCVFQGETEPTAP